MMDTMPERISRRITRTPQCWSWIGPVNSSGYGNARYCGRVEGVHRIAYLVWIGPIPEGMEVDHLCRMRRCVNPDHLELVTRRENNRRVASLTTQCPNGHEYDEENTNIRHRKGWVLRECRKCSRARNREYRRRTHPLGQKTLWEAAG